MMFASYSPGSSLAAIQVTVMASHAWGGRAARFQQRVARRAVPAALRISVPQRARRRPRGVDPAEWSSSRSPTGRSGTPRRWDGEPVQLRLGADPRAKENCGREVRPGREHDDSRPVDVTLVVDDADRAAMSNPVDEGVRSHGQVRAHRQVSRQAASAVFQRTPDDVRRKGSGAWCAQVVQVVETREPERLRSLDEKPGGNGLASIRVRGRCSERRPCATRDTGESSRTTSRDPLLS